MHDGALAPYEHSLRVCAPLGLLADNGRVVSLDVARWLAPADPADRTVVARCRGPVLDVGCGPGRFVRALGELGIAALGVDIADTAVMLTRGLGVVALQRSVFDALPGEGRWPTILVMDGNIGIGADPVRLLRRLSALLVADGQLLVEVDPDPDVDEVLRVRFTQGGTVLGPTFDWSQVGLRGLTRYAAEAGCHVSDVWRASGRPFASVTTRRSRTTRSA